MYIHVTIFSTWSTIPSRAESNVGCKSLSKCMIRLHLHNEAGALKGALSDGNDESGEKINK